MNKKNNGKDDIQNDEVDLTTQTDSQVDDSDDDLNDLRDELEQVKQTASQMEVQLKRAVADYQNLEKRVAEGRSELAQWATSDLIKRLMPVLHHFDQAIQGVQGEEKNSGWFKGVELAYKQLQDILRSEGLEEIRADGQFDPALHEAVDTAEGEHDKILKVAQKGYTLNGKVLQPAKVVVGRKSEVKEWRNTIDGTNNYVRSIARGLRARFSFNVQMGLQSELSKKAYDTGNISKWDELTLRMLPLADRVLVRSAVTVAVVAHQTLEVIKMRESRGNL